METCISRQSTCAEAKHIFPPIARRRPPPSLTGRRSKRRSLMIDNRTAPYAALILRVALGVMFLVHSLYLKVFVFTVAGTVGFFESLGLPGLFAYLTILAEIGGGIALILEIGRAHV